VTAASAEERSLVTRAGAGEERAFEAIVNRHHAAVLWLARCFADGRAEELARDAWEEVLATLGDWDPDRPLREWILSAVAKVARRRPHGAVGGNGRSAAASREPGDGPPWPAALAEEEGALGRLREALAALPPAQRAVVTMRDVARCGARATCAALGLSEEEQRVLLRGGRACLRDALQAHVEAAAWSL